MAYLESETGVRIYVWMLLIKHGDERGTPRDEGIMVGMVSETGGKRLGAKISNCRVGKNV